MLPHWRECLQLREAERLIGRALAGNPPPDIADEC
jgi:hypothetical protein